MNEFLSATLWCGITLAAFFCWRRLFLWIKHPLLHPILWSTVIVVLLLVLTSHSFTAYRQESAPLLWLLGPAVVAMAVPIWQRRELILANWRALLLVIVLGIAFFCGQYARACSVLWLERG
jgi:putative effector of murein hydrolase